MTTSDPRPVPPGGAAYTPSPSRPMNPPMSTPTTQVPPVPPAAPPRPAPPSPAPVPPAEAKAPMMVGAPLKSKRRARLVVRRVDPWSVLKFSLLFSICLLVVFVVAVAALYFALDALGVFDSLNKALGELTSTAGDDPGSTGGVQVVFSASTVITGAAVIGAINVVIITAICTLGAFLYNLCSDVVGGIEVTLAERE